MTTLATVAWIDAAFSREAIRYWIFGGFAVDLHVGEQTRPHDDVDVAVEHADFLRASDALAADGWTRIPTAESGYATFERASERIDLASVGLDDPSWPAETFGDDVGECGGVRARVIGRAALLVDKRVPRDDPSTRAKDAADVQRLERALTPSDGV